MCFACLVGRAYFILSSLRKKNIKLKLVLNNAVLKGWKAVIRFWSEKVGIQGRVVLILAQGNTLQVWVPKVGWWIG